MKFYLNKSLALTFVLFTLLLTSSCNQEPVLKPFNTTLNSSNSEISTLIPMEIKESMSNLKIEVGDIKDPESYLLQKNSLVKRGSSKSNYLHFDKTTLLFTYLGLAIKGSGGGGGFIDCWDILNKISDIDIYDISSVEDDKLYIVAGGIGAPTALKANLDSLIISIVTSAKKLAKLKGKELGGILSVESGPANAMIAMLISKNLSLPLIDADGAGRSVPSLTNLSYAHENYSIDPTVLTSVIKIPVVTKVLHPLDAEDAEKAIRDEINKIGQIGGLALWAQTGSELKASSIVKNTYYDAFILGIYTYYAMFYDTIYLDLYFQNYGGFISSYMGVLTDVKTTTEAGFDKTILKVTTTAEQNITIKAINENLILNEGPNTIITAPNLISYMVEYQPNYFIPLNNGDADIMQYFVGQRIYIINSSANRRLYDFGNTFLTILKKAYQYNGLIRPLVYFNENYKN